VKYHYRYVYKNEAVGAYQSKKALKAGQSSSSRVRARLQELGPRFTLKLKWLMTGTIMIFSKRKRIN
jgi:hypothetical protein